MGFALRRPHLPALLAAAERGDTTQLPAVLELTPSHLFGRSELLAPLVDVCAFVLHDVLASPATLAPLDLDHLERVAQLARALGAHAYSEHLAMLRAPGGVELGHLIPLPLTPELLTHLCAQIRVLRERLQLPVALELPTTSLRLPPLPETLSEGVFVTELVARSGCGLHLDLENLRIDARNATRPRPLTPPTRAQRARDQQLRAAMHGSQLDAELIARIAPRLAALPLEAVTRVHLAGGTLDPRGWHVDSHSAPVHDDCVALLCALRPFVKPRAIIIERDANLPSYAHLLAEARRVETRWARAPA